MARGRGMDPQEKEELIERILSYIHNAIPDPPVSVDGDLCILFDADGGGVDRLSRLPDALLGNIVTRLPIKDAARTASLSRRWRPIWRSAPLVLVDAHLLPAGDDEIPDHVERADSNSVAAAVSSILAVHPGPIRCAHLTCCYMNEFPGQVARWLQHLAVKGVEELFLINRPWPLDIMKHMPTTIFMATLTRLYLGFWRFPDTRGFPRGAAFPYLRELGLCSVIIEPRDIDFILDRSPVLDMLNLEGRMVPLLPLRLVSQSLRCVQIHASKLVSITMVHAPRLERLIISNSLEPKMKIKIGHAPALSMFGYFELGKDVLQVGNTIIKAGTPVTPTTMVASVKILALTVRFGIRNDAKMLPNFLRCFPNLDILHIHSKKTAESTGRLNLKFWYESGAIECIQSHVTMMAFHDFRGERSELSFLKFVVESAQKLEVLVVQFANGCVNSGPEAVAQVKSLFAGKRGAPPPCSLLVLENKLSEGEFWDFERGSDYSNPFALFQCKGGGQFSV
ncbi:hypothetical protein EJB05_47313 [Eragrostis curvula]|uniref:F-box domain-containing protein n=1 Tax=Eragrostis curvula TaxID=38414 RepID=A0A5J9T7D1_9POAL|nr:hypothetical protein EJB05_47313 [Eragrostis curvula]